MTKITSEQIARYTVNILNGLNKPVDAENPVAASSDETVATVTEPTLVSKGVYTFDAVSVMPGEAHITFTADADVSEDVKFVVAEDDLTVEADPRLDERTAAMTAEVVDE